MEFSKQNKLIHERMIFLEGLYSAMEKLYTWCEFNATVNDILLMSWLSVLLVEKTIITFDNFDTM
jgi:hypothetical protein